MVINDRLPSSNKKQKAGHFALEWSASLGLLRMNVIWVYINDIDILYPVNFYSRYERRK